jgi:predicted amidohydrolase
VLARGFERPLSSGELGVATTSFDDGGTIEWSGERATAICDGSERGSKLWAAIEAAERDGFDVLVAPELTVTPAARRWITRQLRWRGDVPGEPPAANPLALVAPGSFHEQVGARFVHRAILLDGAGNAVLEHHKLVPFGTLASFVEDIHPGDSVTLLITPIGTVAIAICKDFCDDHVGAIWHHLQPEWLLVPAYGGGARAHEAAAARIGRMLGTITVLAHQGDAAQNAPFNSFIHEAGTSFETSCNAPHFTGRKIRISKTNPA